MRNELDKYGYPPRFIEKIDGEEKVNDKKVKSKIATKGGNLTYQWNIMKNFGLKDEEIKKFIEPFYWLEYFPKHAIADLKRMGIKVDWRRSFITTDVNLYYDSFIRWQFYKLKEKNYIKFGKRYTVYSPKDKQPCMDHDRLSGEGVGAQEYILVKFKLLNSLKDNILNEILKNKTVYLLAATLRVETIYGVTNVWLHPDIEYIIYKSQDENIYYLSTERSAKNASYQGLTFKYGEYEIIHKIKGIELFGSELLTINGIYDKIYILPMLTVKEDKGTGVVMSVPSDSPDDYATLMDLIKKDALCQKFNIKKEMLLEPVPIILLPDYGELCAKMIYEKLNIKSQNDTLKLTNAKDTIYKKAFYEGKMIVNNEYFNMPIKEAKIKIQENLIKNNIALIYKEPESKIISRSGDECVVALCDQWYLNYGEEIWKNNVKYCLDKIETYNDETKNNFNATLDWLHEHACARSFGLGTKLPWDEQYLIESLSDSTIYMCYYTIAHLIQGNQLKGNENNILQIKPEQLTNKVWDYIFLENIKYPEDCGIDKNKLDIMKREFKYWYGVDLRVSGKDLIPNHLTYYLYNHVAIWPNDEMKWPKSIRANGHLLLNSEKMSKSTGNFLTLDEALEKYGADAVRLALADSGDTIEDANFVEKIADTTVLRLYTFLEWTKEVLEIAKLNKNLLYKCQNIFDQIFENEINYAVVKSKIAYKNMLYREALKCCFYELQNARDNYKEYCNKCGYEENIPLLIHFIYIQIVILSPICPHLCEHIFIMLKDFNLNITDKSTILNVKWPNIDNYDLNLINISRYIENTSKTFRARLKNKKDANNAIIYVTDKYNAWQTQIIKYLTEFCQNESNDIKLKFPDNKQLVLFIKSDPTLKSLDSKKINKVMSFVQYIKVFLL